MSATLCSCGNEAAHVIARRQTLDERTIELWSDGCVTMAMGFRFDGIGAAVECYYQDADRTAGWALLGEVGMLTLAEVPAAFTALRRLCRQPYDRACSWRWPQDRDGPTPEYARTVIWRAVGAAK